MRGAAVLWRLRAIVHAVIADYAGNAQPVVFENRCAALALGLAVLRHVAPCRDGGFIAEERQRQDFAFLGQAFEPFDRDKAVDGFEDRLQFGREVEVFFLMFRPWPDFEDHSDHLQLPCAWRRSITSPSAEMFVPPRG